VQERGSVAPIGPSGLLSRATGRYAALGGIAITVVALDQLTKTWAERALADEPIHVIWTLWLDLTYNPGAAFGSARGFTPVITALAVAVLIALVGLSRSTTSKLGVLALGMVIGGATGNLVDRLVRDNGGAVIDFIDFRWYPVFNVADMAVVIGAALLIISSRRQPEPTR
jgi:signal peptidase II